MTNTLYGKTREKLGRKLLDLIDPVLYAAPPYTLGLKVALIDEAFYTPLPNSDEYFSIIPGGAVVASSDVLTSGGLGLAPPTFVLGVLDADDVTITGLVTPPSIESLVIYQQTDLVTPGSWPLIAYINVANGTLPVTPSGTVTIQWAIAGNLKI
jgi:hypothetical protein